jgi:TPR repeat protein
LAECYRAGQGTAADAQLASEYFEKACRGGVAASCYAQATMYRGSRNEDRAREKFQQACDLSIRHEIANAAYFRAGSAAAPDVVPRFCAQLQR